MATNPICTTLQANLETGIATLGKAIKFQGLIKKQIDLIVKTVSLDSALNDIPNISVGIDTDSINSILASCPGAFPDIPSIELFTGDGLKKYLKGLKGQPLGALNNLSKSLDNYMKPVNDLQNSLYNYLTCMKNICGFVDGFDSKWQEITGLKQSLNLDENGKPQILDSATKNINSAYQSKIDGITAASKQFK